MKVGKTGTYSLIGLKSSWLREKLKFRRGKWIISSKLKHSVIESTLIRFL